MTSPRLKRLIAVARGAEPADLVLADARVVNVFTGEVEPGDVAIAGGRIAAVGRYRKAKRVLDLGGRWVAPGLIDGHVHVESSLLDPAQYARAVVPRGTLGVVTDLHEIANVCGMAGIRYVLDAARGLPLDLFLAAPSCVPATGLETSGARLGPEEIGRLLRLPRCVGLGEMMNFPGLIAADEEALAKVARARARGRRADGHAPGLRGGALAAYIAAGIASDHESVALEEAREKLRRGMHIMIREGSTEKNLDALVPLVTDRTAPRCMFVVDDRSCVDLLEDGDMDAVLRKAVARGLDPVRAIQMATLHPAEYFRLEGLGAVAGGYWANLIVLADLERVSVERVFYRGRLVAERGEARFRGRAADASRVSGTIRMRPLRGEDLRLPAAGGEEPVIRTVPGQILTRRCSARPRVEAGAVVADPGRDLLKLVVAERHRATGNVGRALVAGLGLKRGALASSVAHDSHNIIAAGADDGSLLAAIQEIARLGGGLVAAAEGRVVERLALPIAGLLSDQPLEAAAGRMRALEAAARALGAAIPSPFAVLSFLALPVIPELRLTDKGLVDVNEFRLIRT